MDDKLTDKLISQITFLQARLEYAEGELLNYLKHKGDVLAKAS